MITLMNLKREKTAVLQNAYQISYNRKLNDVWTASFRLPLNDEKSNKVEFFGYVEIVEGEKGHERYIGLFRVMPKRTTKNRATNEIMFECEHVLSTLLDKSLFKYHQRDGYSTQANIQYLLDMQKEKNWVIGSIEFKRWFSYSWENDNLLSAILSIPKPFDVRYQWEFNTQTYPWKLSLVSPKDNPEARIQEGYNMIGFQITEDPKSLFNVVVPLGFGEGANQLDIRRVNGGKYQLRNEASIKKYGEKEYIWVDRRFTNDESLKASAQALLDKWSTPIVSWDVRAVLLKQLTGLDVDEFGVGDVIRVKTIDHGEIVARIMEDNTEDNSDPESLTLQIGNVVQDIGATTTDMERRQKVQELNSQGANSTINRSFRDNCDDTHSVRLKFPIPSSCVYVNSVKLTLDTERFRSYSKAVGGGGASVGTSSAGGSYSSGSTSGASGSHIHRVGTWRSGSEVVETIDGIPYYNLIFPRNGEDGNFYTLTNSGDHTHSVQINIPAHTHTLNIPNHTHEMEFGIWEDSSYADKLTVKIDGELISFTGTSCTELELRDYLSKDGGGEITRGMHTIEVLPNKRAMINADVDIYVFIRQTEGVQL